MRRWRGCGRRRALCDRAGRVCVGLSVVLRRRRRRRKLLRKAGVCVSCGLVAWVPCTLAWSYVIVLAGTLNRGIRVWPGCGLPYTRLIIVYEIYIRTSHIKAMARVSPILPCQPFQWRASHTMETYHGMAYSHKSIHTHRQNMPGPETPNQPAANVAVMYMICFYAVVRASRSASLRLLLLQLTFPPFQGQPEAPAATLQCRRDA